MKARSIHDQLLYLGNMQIRLSQVSRTLLYEEGHAENDAEHSLHLALSATEIAAYYYPKLNTGLIAQFSMVHDLIEVYAGDVPTFDITAEQRELKDAAEKTAHKRLMRELPPHTAAILERYEKQQEPEARLVRLVDKLLPPIIHAVAANANRDYFIAKFNIKSVDEIDARNKRFDASLRADFPEFEEVLNAQQFIVQTARDRLWPPNQVGTAHTPVGQ